MIDLGTVLPGSTLRIPFSSFDKDDGSSITMTNYAVADILIYKDGSTTERASTAGYTATTDFDGKTGKHLAIIDLADDTTADFFKAGSEYLVAIDAVTVDAVTTGGWIARFRIGYPGAQLDTSIATLASQTSFTLTNGPAEDDALNGMWAVVHDKASAVQTTRVVVLDYTGSTKTVTLVAAGTFTIAAGDNFSLMGQAALQPTVTGRTLDVSSTGEGGLDWANIGSPTTAQSLTATRILGLTGTIGEFDDFVDAAGKVTLTGTQTFNNTGTWTGNIVGTVSTLTTYTGNTPQTGDSFARIGATGSGLTTLATAAALATVQADTDDIQTRLPAALTANGNMKSDVLRVNGTVQTAGDLAALINALQLYTTHVVARCTVSGVPTTTSIPTSACSPSGAVADQFKGRIIIFDNDTTTAALRGQATDITASSAAATPTFTVTALTTAPASGDTFTIV